MTRHSLHIIPLLLTVLLGLAACTDTLFEDLQQGSSRQEDDGLGFNVAMQEQNDVIIALGSTRAAQVISPEGTQAREHKLEGDNTFGLKLHSLPLPLVGIHEKAAGSVSCVANATNKTSETAASANATSTTTRANAATDIASTTHFHDSLTIWGFTNKQRVLFRQVTLKKVRDWRSSVHWPYDNDADMPSGLKKPEKMKFYAISPSMEEMEITILNRTDMQQEGSYWKATGKSTEDKKYTTVNYNQPPIFEYRVADAPAEQKDLLMGSSDAIDIQSGPTGSYAKDPEKENLGKDNKVVDLKFKHVLTAIRFAQGKIPPNVYIEDITLYHIKSRGIYDNGWAIEGEDDYETYKKYYGSYTIKTGRTTYMGEDDNYQYNRTGENSYIDGGNVLFMIPHELSSNAELHVTLREKLDDEGGFKTHNLKCSLSGETWNEGYTVIYELTIGKLEDGFYLFATSPEALEHDDGSSTEETFSVQSYRLFKDYADDRYDHASNTPVDVAVAVNWKVVGYSLTDPDNNDVDFSLDNKPSWLESIDGTETNGTEKATPSFKISKQLPTKTGNHETILTDNGQADHVNLSLYPPLKVPGHKEKYTNAQPANCYIVNRKGTYGFPWRYGNGGGKASSENDTECIFKDHTGASIYSDWIAKQLTNSEHTITTYKKNDSEQATDEGADTKIEALYEISDNCFIAELIWQDYDGLITSVASDASHYDFGKSNEMKDSRVNKGGMIGFTVSEAHPGNAVIALKAKRKLLTYSREVKYNSEEGTYSYSSWSGPVETYETDDKYEIVWTWHIWMTDEVYPNHDSEGTNGANGTDKDYLTYKYDPSTQKGSKIVTIQNKDKEENKILPVNLGWVPDEMDFYYYSHRVVWVKIQQTRSESNGEPKTAIVKLEQHARQPLITGTSPVYQWGRPTPIPPVWYTTKSSTSAIERPIYGTTDGRDAFTVQEITSEQEIYQNPTKLVYLKDTDKKKWWQENKEREYWSATSKTMYDPCPSGFSVPKSEIFTGVSLSGADHNYGYFLNIWPDGKNKRDKEVKNASEKRGAYIYTSYHGTATDENSDNKPDTPIPNSERYGDMYYLPATGRWKATTSSSANLYDCYDDNAKGIYWTSEHKNASKGYCIWIHPLYTQKENTIQLKKEDEFTTAMPIRPVGNIPDE